MFGMWFRRNFYWAKTMKNFYHYFFYVFYHLNIKLRPYFRIEFQAACWLLGILFGSNLVSLFIIAVKFFAIKIDYSYSFFIVPIGVSLFNEYYFSRLDFYLKEDKYRQSHFLKVILFFYLVCTVCILVFALKY